MNKQLRNIYNLLGRIDEGYRDYILLNESQESKSIAAAKQLLKSELNMSEVQADKFVRQDIRQQFPVLHHNSKAGKFILGLTRMLLNDNIAGNAQALQRLNATIELISNETHINEYDRNLNGMSAQDLIDRFSGARKEKNDKDREEVNSMEYQQNNDYTIVQIDNFEQSSQYGQYTSWCVTHSENMLDSYTSDGIGQFYFCLKNGFENVPRERGEGCPLDEYGLSMVAVSVDEDGNLNTCTCRWNHDNGGNDNIMGTKQISQLIGKNFYEVFKPNNKWENEIERVTKELATNKKLDYIFDFVDELSQGYYRVGLSKKYNIVKGRKLLSPMWFKYIYDSFEEGFIVVQDNDFNYNLLSKNGKLLSETWFDECNNFVNGYALVLKEGLGVNFINKKGNYLSETWFDDATDMDTDYMDSNIAWVMKDEGCNFITTKGTFLFNRWYDYVDRFYDRDYTTVRQDGKYNILLKYGQLLSKTWFDSINIPIYNSNLAHVRIDNEYNILNLNDGQLLSAQWFDNIQCIFTLPELNLVRLNDKLNVIDKNGNLVYDKWYSSYEDRGIDDYTAIVSLKKKYCLIEKLTGKRMTRWFDYLFKSTSEDKMYGVLKEKALYDVYYDGTTKLIKGKV